MRDLAIFGSEFPEVVRLVNAINRHSPTWRLIGFVDDRKDRHGQLVLGHPVIGDRSLLPSLQAAGAAIFNNVSGKVGNVEMVAELIARLGEPAVSLVHPSIDLSFVEIGPGCLLPDGCIVGAGTRIGHHLSARLHAVISHNVTIEDCVFIGPGAVIGSSAYIEHGAFIGAGATVMTGCRIGRQTVIGAGALVTDDVPAGVTVGGARGAIIRHEGRE